MKRGDWVLMSVGSWFKGSYVPDDREVKGKIVRLGETMDGRPTALVSTKHGQKPNGCQFEMSVEKPLEDLTPTTPEED